jgi:hypothetical protein
MNSTTITIIVVGIVVGIVVIAWLLYKAGFKVKEVTAKAGLLEAKMERATGVTQNAEAPIPRTEATQEATDGGRIEGSTIKGPADSGASLKQKAEGDGSSISDSTIELS